MKIIRSICAALMMIGLVGFVCGFNPLLTGIVCMVLAGTLVGGAIAHTPDDYAEARMDDDGAPVLLGKFPFTSEE